MQPAWRPFGETALQGMYWIAGLRPGDFFETRESSLPYVALAELDFAPGADGWLEASGIRSSGADEYDETCTITHYLPCMVPAPPPLPVRVEWPDGHFLQLPSIVAEWKQELPLSVHAALDAGHVLCRDGAVTFESDGLTLVHDPQHHGRFYRVTHTCSCRMEASIAAHGLCAHMFARLLFCEVRGIALGLAVQDITIPKEEIVKGAAYGPDGAVYYDVERNESGAHASRAVRHWLDARDVPTDNAEGLQYSLIGRIQALMRRKRVPQ